MTCPSLPRSAALACEIEGRVAHVRLSRPDKLNAINLELARDLRDLSHHLQACPEVSVLVLSGSGRAFCSGYDVSEAQQFSTLSPLEQVRAHEEVRSCIRALAALDVVKIAKIHGHCVGAGLLIASRCDLRVGSDESRYSIPELDLGLPFSMGGMQSLIRLVGMTKAMDLVLLRKSFTGSEAYDAGFLNDVVALDDLDSTVGRIAQQISARPRYLLRETVQALYDAGQALMPDTVRDIAALVLSQHDNEASNTRDQYAAKFN